jgi:hypothetical protein
MRGGGWFENFCSNRASAPWKHYTTVLTIHIDTNANVQYEPLLETKVVRKKFYQQ